VEWPAGLFGFNSYIAPFGENLYIVPGIFAGADGKADVRFAGVALNVHYMLPAGDRFVPFIEGGVAGLATRIDVLDFTADDPPDKDRTTYVRGGIQVAAGVDVALGGSWSISAAVRGTFLGDMDTRYVERGGSTVTISEDPSYWELPRVAIVYWY
jgi:opacity protein-like surface antigen